MSWIQLTSVTATNNSNVIVVNTGSTVGIKTGDALLLAGFDLVEVEGVFANQLQLRKPWAYATQSSVQAVVVPTFGDFNNAVEEVRNLRKAASDTLNELYANFVEKEEGKGLSTNDLTDELLEDINNKVDKEEGKGLSTNDYDDDAKEKVDGLRLTTPRFGVSDMDEAHTLLTDVYRADGSVANRPQGLSGTYSVLRNGQFVTVFYTALVQSRRFFRTYSAEHGSSGWLSGWQEILHSGNVVNSPTDVTAGKVAIVGYGGIGRITSPIQSDYNIPLPSGMYSFSNVAAPSPGAGARTVLNLVNSNNSGVQIAGRAINNQISIRSVNGENADPFVDLYHTGNAVAPVSAGGLVEFGVTPNGRFWRYAGGMQITQAQVSIDFTNYLSLLSGGVFSLTIPAVAPFQSSQNPSGFISMVHAAYSAVANRFLANTHLNVDPSNGSATLYRIDNSDMSNADVSRSFLVTLIGKHNI
ncbi:hypothetical protein [Vibrio injensis]|uniref:hypothetical protein n=1 Tax=Vibrio injensis TaxID=1307414 RepID=UPI000933CB8A|nr:hypothetical protein [Vibrio injensis]